MVEYVLGGSPTNKESPLSVIESRFSVLKFDETDKVSVRFDISQQIFRSNGINRMTFFMAIDDRR